MTERTETTFYNTGAFSLNLVTQSVAAVPGAIHIQIASRWGHAKDPQDEQQLLGLTLDRSELTRLIEGLQDAVQRKDIPNQCA